MPLYEFLRLAAGKLESGQQKPCSTDLSSRTENDLVELVCENGQITTQGQSSRVTRSPTLQSLPSNTPRIRDTPRTGKFGGVESILNENSSVMSSGHLDLSQNDEIVPWLSYPVDDGLQDYCSDLLPEISIVTTSGMLAQNSFVSGDKGSSCDQAVSSLDALKVSSCKYRSLCSWPPHQDQTSGDCAQGRDVVDDSRNVKMGTQNVVLPSNNSSLLNFSYFSRPTTLVKANFPNSGGIPPSVSSGEETVDVKEKCSASRCSNLVESMLIEQLNNTEKDIDCDVPSASTVVKSRLLVAEEPKESVLAERTENLCQELYANSTKGIADGDRTVELTVGSSSVGSGNSSDRVSCEQTQNTKRKFRDVEEFDYHSEDIETESVGVKKPTLARGGTGSKRSRAAEVHNLSERRRRDRINEKMRALQELIPNCNKVDKASMLDEAIEYLKNLQLQLQIMSMGAGLCMPQMMFPPGTQHMHPARVPYFSPMHVGMGMLDVNGGSTQCPIFPVSPVQRTHFPSSALGPTNFHRIPGPNLPLYGHPRQGPQSLVPKAPLVPLTGWPHITPAMVSSALRMSSHNEAPSKSSPLNSKDPVTNKNPRFMRNAEVSSSINHRSNQLQATNDVSDQSTTVQDNNQTTDVRSNEALTSTTTTGISKEAGCK